MSSPKTTPHWKQYNRLPTKKYHDPWARREAWRHHEMFSPRYQLMRLIPGFTWGVAAFIVYLGVEKVMEHNNSIKLQLQHSSNIKTENEHGRQESE